MNATTGSEKGFRQVKENKFFMDFVRVTGILPALFWTRPKIYYAGNKKKSLVKGGVLIASNHVTFRDPLLLFCVFWRRRLRFLATKDLYKNRLITLLFSAMGHIQVDKDNVRMDTLHQAVDCLKEGDALPQRLQDLRPAGCPVHGRTYGSGNSASGSIQRIQ